MKKLLLSFMAVLLMISFARAEMKVLTITNNTVTDSPVTIASPSDATFFNPLRLYAGKSLTISVEDGYYIEKAEFTTSGSYSWTNVKSDIGTLDTTNKIWNAPSSNTSVKSVKITNGGTGQIRIASISVTYSSTGSSAEKTAKPEISGTTPFEESTTVTIVGTGDIYYTLDGSSPTIESTKYTAPINLENSAVVKAIAKEENKDASDIAEMSFKKSSSSSSVYYQQVKNTDELSENDVYVIAYDNGDGTGQAISTKENENNRSATTVNISDNILTATEETLLITLEKDGDSWKLCGTNYLGSDKYFLFNQTGKTNIKMTDASSATTASISFSTQGNVQIRNNASGENRYIKYNGSTDFRYYADGSGKVIKLYKQIELTKKETVTLTWGEASSEYTVGQEGVTFELSAEPVEALESVVVTSSDPAVTVDYTTIPGLVELSFNGACDNVTLTAAIPEDNEKYTAESKSISFAVKAPVVVLTPEEIIATPALNEENEVTVKKGETVTFSSKNASKLSVSVFAETATLENNPFIYTVTEETILEIIPVDSEGNLYTDLKKEISIYIDENIDPQPTKATSTVTFDFVKNDHLCTDDNYINDLNSDFYIRSRELGLIEAYIALEQDQTASFNYTGNQGWNFNINGENETKFQFVFYPNSEFESYGYKLTGIKIEGDFDDKFVVFNDYITGSELTNSMWNGHEDIVMLEAVALEDFTISSIDVTFEHDIVKMPELFGQDGKLGLSHRDGHDIYYKVVAENSQMRTVNRDPAYDDNFQLYTEPFTLRDGETIYAYAQHPHGMVSEILAKTYADIATGVEGIASDDAEGDVKYFNLQGVEVENPAEGIYIRVANGKAEKIIK